MHCYLHYLSLYILFAKVRWLPYLLIGLFYAFSGQATLILADTPLVTQEIRYRMPEAGEVYLVWGINGWNVVPEETRPPGTVVGDALMYTPMVREGDVFIARVHVPSGATIDYGFLITKQRNGTLIRVWEEGGNQTHPLSTAQNGSVEVQTRLKLGQDQINTGVTDTPLVTQEFHYYMPKAGEVYLIWGINGWNVVPEEIRPPGTVAKDALMHTPMVREEDVFIASVYVPSGATVDYGFLITKRRSGGGAPLWEPGSGQEAPLIVTKDGLIEVETALIATPSEELLRFLKVGANLLLGACLIFVTGVIIKRIPREHGRCTIALLLLGMMLLGLGLRLWVAWDTNQGLPDTPARLVGDEPGYDSLASDLLRGSFFQSPDRTPVYPLFLAGTYFIFGHSYARLLYVQAFVGITVIPLSYFLARYFVTSKSSLLVALLATLHPILILHVTRLYSEILYTPLLLLAILSLLWAMKSPGPGRFIVAGALLAVVTLCRPATLLMPLILPLILPQAWSIRRRLTLCVAYIGTMVAVIAPWTYHNYRTYDTFLPLSVSTYTVWQASPEYYHLMKENWTALEIYATYVDPANNGGHNAATIEGSSYFTARAIASIKAEPGVYAWYSLQKLIFFWIGHPANYWEWPFNFDWMFNYLPMWQITTVFASRLVPLLGLMGLIVLRRRWRLFMPLLLVCTYFMLFHALLISEVRYSEPLHPILIILIVAAANEVVSPYPIGRQGSAREIHHPGQVTSL